MSIFRRLWWGIILVALMVSAIAYRVNAQTPGSQYFPETNHTVSDEFLNFYRSIPEPFVVLGYPIDEAGEDPVTHNLVQYFQLGRLELHPEAAAGARVYISDLGELLYSPNAPLADVPDTGPTCRLFPATGKRVCYAFLQFYDAHGGAQFFGNPISALEVRDGRYVQYFQKARMEWRPEAPAGQRVGLTDLGRSYYDLVQGRPSLTPVGGHGIKLASLQVRAFVGHSLLSANSQQTLYVIVQDQGLNPVAQAATGIVVTFPDGREERYRPPATDANGITVFNFNVGNVDVKQIVKVEVTAASQGIEQRNSTWFRIWW
jgi:hypothetical protein